MHPVWIYWPARQGRLATALQWEWLEPVAEDPRVATGVGIAAVVLVLGALVLRRRRSSAAASRRAHEAAREREPPVEIGETHEFGVTEFTDHHSGERVAVGKVEGFVVFAEDVPDGVEVGDVVRARILSFNRGKTSADATVVGTQ